MVPWQTPGAGACHSMSLGYDLDAGPMRCRWSAADVFNVAFGSGLLL